MQEITIIIRNGQMRVTMDGVALTPQALKLEYLDNAPLLLSIVLPPEREGPCGGYLS